MKFKKDFFKENKRHHENDKDYRQRSRSKSKEREKEHSRYITSNTRATVPLKLEGEDKEI